LFENTKNFKKFYDKIFYDKMRIMNWKYSKIFFEYCMSYSNNVS